MSDSLLVGLVASRVEVAGPDVSGVALELVTAVRVRFFAGVAVGIYTI